MVRFRKSFPNNSVVINLSIDSKGNGFILVGKWLRSTVNTDDTQPLVSKNLAGLATAMRGLPILLLVLLAR